ncbi:MAG: chalcone isomerase family protein [Flavobacteriales bacterium]
MEIMKNMLTIILAAVAATGLRAQMKIGDVTLPNTLKVDNTTLLLNGGGIREKFWMDMYVGGLYLKEKSGNAAAITKADSPMAIRLHIVSGLISSSRMTDAVEEGFEKSTGGKTEPLRKRIDAFKAVFDKEPISVNDVYDIAYLPGTGVKIFKNKKEQALIKGLDFKQALWGIWLCDDPADEDLKEGMLGK